MVVGIFRLISATLKKYFEEKRCNGIRAVGIHSMIITEEKP